MAYKDEVIANQERILANQERIESNQTKLDELLAAQAQILTHQEKFDVLLANQDRLQPHYGNYRMIGESPAFKGVLKEAQDVAEADTTVLLQGETGTGKELLARAIHAQSSRHRRPLITVNCATLPESLFESELFGHEKGAFTGAHQRQLGRFEVADGGTIFLDEIGEVPLETQVKFLRVLQEGEFERLGSYQTVRVNVRVIAATNQPLEQLVAERRFRADLFYRLNVFPITLPPLRDRRQDILLLVNYFAKKYRARHKKSVTSISETSLRQLEQYHWPGNIRELEHLVERAVLTADGEVLTINLPPSLECPRQPIEWPPAGPRRLASGAADAEGFVTLDENERRHIERVLRHTRGRIAGPTGAAEILGVNPSTLRSRMKRLGLK